MGITLLLAVYYLIECVIVSVKDLVEKREVYKHRIDKLESKVHNMTTGLITEYFAPGRLDCLKGLYTLQQAPCR